MDSLLAIKQHITDISASWDAAGKTIFLNQAGRDFFGVDALGISEQLSLEQWYPDAEARMIGQAALPAAAREGSWYGTPLVRDGRKREHRVEQWIVAVRAADGALVGYSTIVRLPATPGSAGEVFVGMEEIFSRLLRASPYVALITEQGTGRIIDVSDRLCDFLGARREQLIGHVNAHEAWVDPAESESVYAELERTGVVYDREVRLYDRERKVRTGHFSGAIVTIGDRKCVHAVFADLTSLKQTETALRESEELFSKAFYASPDPYIIADFSTNLMLDVNDAYCRVFGVTREEAIGRKNSDLGLWADVAHRDRFVELMASHGEVHEMEQHRRNRKGETVVCRVTAFRTEIGGRACTIYRMRDITRERQAEQGLRESEEKFSKAFHASSDPIAIGEFPGGQITEVNDAFCELFGCSRTSVVGHSGAELGLWADLRDRARFVELLSQTGTVRELEAEKVRRDGRRVTCLITSHRLEIGGRQRMVTRFTDITERNKAVQALRESEEKFHKAFHAMPDSVAISTLADGRIIDSNEGFTRMTGWAREEAIGHTIGELGLWTDAAQRDSVIGRLRHGEPVRTERIVVRNRQGELRQGLLSAVALDIGGQACRISIVRDITERQRMEEQLRQAQKMESLGQLAGGVAHDFNNILTVIQGHASFLLQEGFLAPSVREPLTQIQRSCAFAADLTRQLLLFSRSQAIKPGPVSLPDMVGQVKVLLDRVIGENIELKVTLPPGLPPVEADAGMVEQVLLNLVVNARDAMPAGGRIVISVLEVTADGAYLGRNPQARPGRFAGLRVSDSGQGIPPEILPKIFDPFFTTKTEGKGTGLGLATVYGIVQQHGGWIDVDSQPGRGTTFTIWFPVSEKALASHAAPAPVLPRAPVARGRETILVVEDKEDVRAVLRAVLERFGYRVLLATDGADALGLWAQHGGGIALLLTDVMMPGGLTGKDLARQLRAQRPDLKVVFCSGYDANILDRATLQEPGTRFLTKPFEITSLVAMVRETLDATA
jgi:PAS domain S-box-containing protein